jgi:hypothetical protein
MKFSKTLPLTILLAAILLSLQTHAQLPPENPNYKIVFQDEFDQTFPTGPIDPKKWARTPPWNQRNNVTDNVSWCFPGDTNSRYWDRAYTMRDPKDTTTIKVSNGTCKLITNKANYQGEVSNWPPCDPNNPGYAINGKKCRDECKPRGPDNANKCWTTDVLPFKYTTGFLFSKDKFYRGYFEIRFKLPPAPESPYTHQGFGPNFWLYGNTAPVNWRSEIDVFEIFAFNPPLGDTNKFTSTVHYSDKNVSRKPKAHSDALGNRLKNDTAWHKAAAWWTDKFVKIYFDDSLYFTVQGIQEIPVEKLVEMNIIVDINSPTDVRCNNFDPVYTKFPYVYEVDYVRVYQEK